MNRPVLWSRRAVNDMAAQASYIARDNPAAARRVSDGLKEVGDALGRAPIGRPGRRTGTYEKSVSGLPYIIAYAIGAQAGHETIVILRVIHTSRDWQPEGWPD